MATNDSRVDTTFIGYLVIGFLLLLMGVFGLQEGGLFGDANASEEYAKLPIDWSVLALVCGTISVVLVVLMIFAYRTGKGPAAAVFAFFAVFSFVFYLDYNLDGTFHDEVYNSSWFIYVALAIFFLIFALYSFAAKAPKSVATLYLLMAVMILFFALNDFYSHCGPVVDKGLYEAMGIVYSIFAFLGFIVATYLGLAYANPKKIPVI